MKSFRNLIALVWLAFSTTAFAQVVQMTVPFAAGGGADMVARMLVVELTKILGRPVYLKNVAGGGGSVGIRDFSTARTDGSQMLFFSALNSNPAPEVDNLVPIATVVGKTTNWKWAGVFAPPGTPANIAKALERAVIAALNSPGFRSSMEKLGGTPTGFTPTPGDGVNLARLIAQSASGGSAPANSPIATAGTNAQADDPKVVGGSYKP